MQKAVKEFADYYGILDRLIAEDAPPPLADTDLTVSRLAVRAKCREQKAARMLAEWEQAGKAEYIGMKRIPRGHKVKAWRLVVK